MSLNANTRERLVVAAFLLILALILDIFLRLAKTDLNVFIHDWTLRDKFLAMVNNLVTITPFILFALLIALFLVKRLLVPQPDKTESPSESSSVFRPRFMLVAWFLGLLVALGVLGGTSVYVDPRNIYGTPFYPPWVIPDRELKVTAYAALAKTPDMVILGSSRAFAFSPAYITEKTGYSVFNMSLASGRMNDFWIYTQFMLAQHDHTLPKVILMETDYPFPIDKDYTAEYTPLTLLPYMDAYTRQKALEDRWDGLWNVDQFAEALYAVRYTSNYGQLQLAYQVHPDGWTTRQQEISAAEFESDLTAEIGGLTPGCWTHTDPQGEALLRNYLDLARSYGSTVILLRNPYQPRYYDALKTLMPGFDQCETLHQNFFASLTQEYDNLIFADYQTPGRFNGDDTVTGYYDYQHLTVKNATLLLDLLTPTIQQGYQLALKNSAALH